VQVVQSGSPGTLAEVFIRGAPPDQNLIMIDDVPLNDGDTAESDLSRITTDGLQQIEVVRAAGSALYGSQAIGSVVNLLTQEGSGPLKFSLLSEVGNRASQNQTASFDGAEGRSPMRVRCLIFRRTDPERPRPPLLRSLRVSGAADQFSGRGKARFLIRGY
jgi:outer membrane cobalamin receptor